MPDCIVRFGGNNLLNPKIIDSLIALLKKSDKCHLLVVSATRSIQDILTEGIQALVSTHCEPNIIFEKITDEIAKISNLFSLSNYDVNPLVEKLNTLLRGIYFTGDFSLALQDQVISFSEKITATLLHEILQHNNIDNKVHLPEEFGLIVSEEYGNANILTEESMPISKYQFDRISIIPGSYGITKNKKIVRTGYRAADYTAATLTSIFELEQLELWQISKPFKTADETIVPDAEYVDSLTYSEASELSYFNCSGIHPRIVEPLVEKHIPICIYDLCDNAKTLRTTINSKNIPTPQIVKSVAHTDDIAVLKLNGPGVGFKPGILATVTSAFNDRQINIRSVITAQTSINIILDKSSIHQAGEICDKLSLSSVNEIDIAEHVSLIAVVGCGMQTNHGISSRIFGAVDKNNINVLISGSGASDLVSYLVVKEEDKFDAIKEIHKVFFNKC